MELYFDSRSDAENLLETCQTVAKEFGYIAVGDVNTLCGLLYQSSSTDFRMGWPLEEVMKLRYKPDPTGLRYVLKFPEPRSLLPFINR